MKNPGVAEEHIKPAETIDSCFDERVAGRSEGDITYVNGNPFAGWIDLVGRFLGFRGIPPVKNDGTAFRDKTADDFLPDT